MKKYENITKANIYRAGEVWCYAAWAGADYDHSDVLPDAETAEEAHGEVRALFPTASIRRV